MNNLNLRFPDFKSKALTLSYDDGVEQDERLIRLMEKYGIKGTFNINSGLFSPEGKTWPEGHVHRRLTAARAKELYSSENVEVATHGYVHPLYGRQPPSMILSDILADRRALEGMFGRIIRGHAYPCGDFAGQTVPSFRMAGIVYGRTTISTRDFKIPEDFLKWNPTCHHNDSRMGELTEKFLSGTAWNDPWLFYLWGHAYEFEADNNWQVIEDFFAKVAGRPDVWYATNIEIYKYLEAFSRIVFSADSNIMENPSGIDLFVLSDGKCVKLPACAETKLPL